MFWEDTSVKLIMSSAAEGTAVRYTARCHHCTGQEVACDELRDDQRCPKCGSVPSSYEADGEVFCWPHRERMASRYPVSPDFLTTVYPWRGQSQRFPNAKLFAG